MIARVILCTAALALGGMPDTRAEIWTLARTVAAAVEASNQVAQEHLGADQAVLDAENARAGHLPSVSMTARAGVVSEVMEMHLVPGRTIQFGDYDSYDLALRVNQIIYDGGRLSAAREAALNRAEAAEWQARAAALTVEFRAKASFFGVLLADRAVEAAGQSVTEAQLHLNDVLARRRQELALETDVTGARLRVSQAEMELVTREADSERARATMRALLALSPDTVIEIAWNDAGDNAVMPPSGDAAAALGNRPEMEAFARSIAAAEKSADAAHAGSRPTLGMYGGFNYGRPELDMVANDWMHYFSAGISLNWDIWNWGQNNRQAEQALIGARQVERQADEFTRELGRQLAEARADWTEAVKRRDIAAESVEYASQRLEQINTAYREGMATETDYDTAHAAFSRAVMEESVAEAAMQVAAARIEYVMGIRYTGGTE